MSRLQLLNTTDASPQELAKELAEEFARYDVAGQKYHQPLINIDQPGDKAHLLVIWDAWRSFNREDRSRVIMDAYSAAHGSESALAVSVAMGLTQNEAIGMGIEFERSPL